VHLQNLAMGSFERDYAFGVDAKVTEPVALESTFDGIVRADGRIATRNYIGVLTSVNCSATAARAIADYFRRDTRPEALADYPNVDGVVALTHSAGCAMDSEGEGMQVLRRTLAGYSRHPNFAGLLIVGLGCETNQINAMMASENAVEREKVSARHITVGLQCGGSDGYSGITANPALGAAVDLLVRHGGTAILSETPEIYGAEHLLTRRAVSPAIGEKLLARIRWWEDYEQ
jgi:altronate hydrolase